jgi:hypothetical protein
MEKKVNVVIGGAKHGVISRTKHSPYLLQVPA